MNIHVSRQRHLHFVSLCSHICTGFVEVPNVYVLPCRVCNQFDEKTTRWKIQLQVASILIRFMWCHFNWKYILHKSDEIIWTWLMFQRFLKSDPVRYKLSNETHWGESKVYITVILTIILAVIVCKPLARCCYSSVNIQKRLSHSFLPCAKEKRPSREE